MMLTDEYVQDRVAKIKDAIEDGDYESAMSIKHTLYRDVLRAIAFGFRTDAQAFARKALQADEEDEVRRRA
jgi:hypothetical protein